METTVDGVAIHYAEVGQGRPVLALHGWPADHNHVRHELEPCFEGRPGWRRLYPDLPGMGLTPSSSSIASQADMVELMGGFLDAVAPGERVVVAGASYGAYLGRWLTHVRGSRLDGFLAYVPGFRFDSVVETPPPTVLVPDAEVLADLGVDEQLWASASTVHSRESLEVFRTVLKPAFARADVAFLGRLESAPVPVVPSRMLPAFGAPTLILAGRQDSWCGYADAWSVLEDYPRATFAVLDRAAHGLAGEQPVLFRALVSEWLDRVEEYAAGVGATVPVPG